VAVQNTVPMFRAGDLVVTHDGRRPSAGTLRWCSTTWP